jgi:hypothetical protein
MHKKLLDHEPVCNLGEAIYVFPVALITLAKLMSFTYPRLMHNLQRSAQVAFVSLLWGIMFLNKHSNPTGIAKKLGKLSHDRLQRLRDNSAVTATVIMLELFQQAMELMTVTPHSQTMLILDDVLIPKPFAKFIQGAYWDHDHALKMPCFGIRVVVLLWSNGSFAIPVAFLVWHKRQDPMPSFAPRRYRSKNELARILVYCVYRKGLRFCVLTFDTWYAKKENLILFNRLDITWVTALESNRWIRLPLETPRKNPRGKPTTHENLRCEDLAARYPKREQYSNYPALDLRAKGFTMDLTTKICNLKLVIVKDYLRSLSFAEEAAVKAALAKSKKRRRDPNKYLLTNHLDANVSWVIRCYKRRYQIEWAFREAKQHLALEACSARKFSAVTQHISLSFLGFVCLQQLHNSLPCQVKNDMTLGEYRRQLQGVYRIRIDESVYLVNLSEKCETVDTILNDVLSEVEHSPTSDKPLGDTKQHKTLSYLDLSMAA